MNDRLLTTREVAERLAVNPETVLRWHRSGKLPGGRRLGCNVLRFDAGEVDAWLGSLATRSRLTGDAFPGYYPGDTIGNGGRYE